MSRSRRQTDHARRVSQYQPVVADIVITCVALLVAYSIRYEFKIPASYATQMLWLMPIVSIARVFSNHAFGVYSVVWRYMGLHDALRCLQAAAMVSAIIVAIRWSVGARLPDLVVPYSVVAMEGLLVSLAMTGIRFVPRIMAERVRNVGIPTLLIGAGQGATAILREAWRHPELQMAPVGLLDDDPAKQGMKISSCQVLGGLPDIATVLERTSCKRVIITTQAISPAQIAAIMDACNPHGVAVNIVKGLYESLTDDPSPQSSLSMREVRIEDLLAREPVAPSLSMLDLRARYGHKRIIVTGAGGSIGGELVRQLALLEPALLVLAERDETNLFAIEHELAALRQNVEIRPLLIDIMDREAVARMYAEFAPDVVFHAAAYKHVPMMERFPWEAARNNVFATKHLAELANEAGVGAFVMISTDKAINPTSVMGATKRIAEQVVQDLAKTATTKYSCVRFGNVLGSRGSVVGIFREQIASGGPVTVTHADATRYFMTIPEAANLVLQAGTLGARGEVFLLDMGEPVKIIDLARQMIRLSGFSEAQRPIKIIGTRPGEKLFEELSTASEDLSATDLRKVFRCRPIAAEHDRIAQLLVALQAAVSARDAADVRRVLSEFDIGYQETGPRHAP
ncbi:MAG: polysaccharide biosynthesis protein [Myxococcales bacterium]|nr:polysaccharide biosynthesis protein [Myxococcales bacterium]